MSQPIPASSEGRAPGFHAAVAGALAAAGNSALFAELNGHPLPDRTQVLESIGRLHRVLVGSILPIAGDGASGGPALERELASIEAALADQIHLALPFPPRRAGGHEDEGERHAEGHRIARELIARLPELRECLLRDIGAAWRGDPSCPHPIEALYSFPGVFAVTRHRIAHVLHEEEVPLLPRLIAEDAHQRTGIDIHPGARIGCEFFIDHGTGVVIGETAVVGNRVRLYQGVTLGARSFPVDDSGRLVKGLARHPIVEDEVTIYASATVLGRVTVGRGSIIGGNVWLTHDVPPYSRVAQAEPLQTGFEDGAGI